MPDLPQAAALTDLYGRRAPVLPKARAATAAYPPGFNNLPQESFELLSTPPSPHGWRLQQAIGLGTVKGTVQSVDSARGRRISSVRAGDRTLRGDTFILATGRHIGGGLDGGRTPKETLLNLWGFHDGEPGASAGTRLQHLQYIALAQELRSGLRTAN